MFHNSTLENRLGKVVETADSKVGMKSDGEGGNIWVKGTTDNHWEIDSYNGSDLRFYTLDGAISFIFTKTGDFYLPCIKTNISSCLKITDNNLVEAGNFPDCLMVDLMNKYASNNLNKMIYHKKGISIKGYPNELPIEEEFTVLREVVFSSEKHLFIKLTCFYVSGEPLMTGTTWYNAYTINEGWHGWIKK